jgi:hypothetical protein
MRVRNNLIGKDENLMKPEDAKNLKLIDVEFI